MITILGIKYDFDFTPARGESYPSADAEPYDHYKCIHCGWTYDHKVYGNFLLNEPNPLSAEGLMQLAEILEFHQDRCSSSRVFERCTKQKKVYLKG